MIRPKAVKSSASLLDFRPTAPESLLGFPVLDDGQVMGHMQFFDQDFLAALNVVDALVSLSGDLAWVIDAAGGLALDHAGKIALA
jgi:hypothetical protein